MSNPARYAAMGVAVFAHYGILVTTGLPYWRVSNWQISDSLYGRIPTFDGIWWKCMAPKRGGFTCNNYGKPTLYVDSGIQMCRGVMCLACVLSFFAMLISIAITDCMTTFGRSIKVKLARTSAGGFVVAGILTLGATTWFGYRVTYEYYDPYFDEREFQYTWGPCLYLGWVSQILSYTAAGLLAFNCCGYSNGRFHFGRPSRPPFYYSSPERKKPRLYQSNSTHSSAYV